MLNTHHTNRLAVLLLALGILALGATLLLMLPPAATAQEGEPLRLPLDYRYWYHLGSKVIREAGAEAMELPLEVFGNTFDAVFANTIALNDLRSGTRPFRDGATFVATFFDLASPVAGLDAQQAVRFTALMVKDSARFADTSGWGFAWFGPEGESLAGLLPQGACYTCHVDGAGENDLIFSTLTERPFAAYPASDNGVFLPPNYPQCYYIGSKAIRPEGAQAAGLPEIFYNTFSDVYANNPAVGALRSGARPFPQGTLFVADFHALEEVVAGVDLQTDLAFTAVMLKRAPGEGDDPSTGDWAFEAFGPDGAPLTDLRPACISCHAGQAENDFVFTTTVPGWRS